MIGVILTLTSFAFAVLAVIAILIAVSLMYRHPTRRCHRCNHRVRLEKRVCPYCGYDFEPIRTTR